MPKLREPLLLYLAATNQVVSVALVAQREVDEDAATALDAARDKTEASMAEPDADPEEYQKASEGSSKEVAKRKVVQRPVYFVSSLLQGARSRYSGV